MAVTDGIHMSAITLSVNGTTHRLDVDPTTPLLYVLSEDLQLQGPKFGCGLSQCGACTAIVICRSGELQIQPVTEGREIAFFVHNEGLRRYPSAGPWRRGGDHSDQNSGAHYEGMHWTVDARPPRAVRVRAAQL